jgi:MYXO-CTERM domain-containing protein
VVQGSRSLVGEGVLALLWADGSVDAGESAESSLTRLKEVENMRQVLTAVLVLGLASVAWAQTGSISDGGATFEWTGSTSTEGLANFNAGGGDNVYQNWWWFRVAGDTAETAFPWAGTTGPDSESYVGDTATLGWEASLTGWTARLQVVVDEVTPGSAATATETMLIQNTGDEPLTLSVFNYLDADIISSSNDSAELLAPGLIEISDSGEYMQFYGVGADAYQVTSYSTLRTALRDDAVTDLDDSGLPFGPGDFTGAFQWDLVIEPGAQATIVEGLSINTDAVPEPAMLSLLALGGLALVRRR